MAFCAFDDSVAGFDVTPVENMFITEYMLRAPGDYVKVYLYGLMLCYHSTQRMSLSSMARDLDMSEEEVEHAFRYWARNGLVRQVGDHPVCYAYMNIKQLTLTRAQDPGEKLYNRAFIDEVRRILGDRLSDSADYSRIYDWIDVYELSEEVVLMLLRYEMKKSGGRFSFKVAEKTARDWAQRGVRTVEDADRLVLIDDGRKRELKKLLARLGQRREPSDDEKDTYNKWIDEWGFTPEAIQEACRETTKGVPTMAYLDGILLRQHQLGRHEAQALSAGMAKEHAERDFAREVYTGLGRVGIAPTAEDLQHIEEWIAGGLTQEMILMAVGETHARGGGTLEDVDAKLAAWKRQGFETADQVRAGRLRVRALNDQLREIYGAAGLEKRVNQPDRDLLSRWMGTLGMSMELVLLAAGYARGSGAPMKVADRMLEDWRRAGIHDEAAARAEHEAHVRTGKGAPAAQTARSQDVLLRQTPQERRAAYSAAVVDLDEEES